MTGRPEDLSRHDAAPEDVADDRFVHGMLEYLHKDGRAQQTARVDRVMASLNERTGPRRTRRWPGGLRRGISAGALVALTALALLLVESTSLRSAQAVVDSALNAERGGGERRYEILAQMPGDGADEWRSIGVTDVREDDLVIRIKTPHGHMFVVGQDEQGAWALRRDGGIERFDVRRAWPRWMDDGEASFLVDPTDALLERLTTDYVLELVGVEDEPGPAHGCVRVDATRQEFAPPGDADRIVVWVDPATHMLTRMDLRWDHAGGDRPGAPGHDSPGGGHPDRGGPPRDAQPERPGGWNSAGGPPPRPRDGRPPEGRGPERRDPKGPGGRGEPDGQGRSAGGPDGQGRGGSDERGDGGPDGRGRTGPEGRGAGGGSGAPDGPGGRGERRGAGGPDHRPPPPRVIRFERVETPPFDDDWFSPDRHRSPRGS